MPDDVVKIYVALLDEGVDVWRPVEARHISGKVYELLEQHYCETETWEFQPGTRVVCEPRQLHEGERLVAVLENPRGMA